jgi:hypothetical protein
MGKPYEVGYGRPPVATRFKPGQSGNPSGWRAKKTSPLEAEAKLLFGDKHTLRENGKAHRRDAVTVIKKVLLAKAMKGDQRSIEQVLKRADLVQEALTKLEEQRDPHAEKAQLIVDAIAKVFSVTTPKKGSAK